MTNCSLQQNIRSDEGEFMPIFTLHEDEDENTEETFPEILPILAMKNTVLFPGIVSPINAARDKISSSDQQSL